MSESIADLVTRARERAGLSMNALASASGVAVATISRLESGEFDPRWSTVDALMRTLGTTIDHERDRSRFEQEAAHRNRLGNVLPAARLAAPSFDNVELWTLLEGTTVGGKPIQEQRAARATLARYDEAVGEARRETGDESTAARDAQIQFDGGRSLAESVAFLAGKLAVFTGKHLSLPSSVELQRPSEALRFATI